MLKDRPRGSGQGRDSETAHCKNQSACIDVGSVCICRSNDLHPIFHAAYLVFPATGNGAFLVFLRDDVGEDMLLVFPWQRESICAYNYLFFFFNSAAGS